VRELATVHRQCEHPGQESREEVGCDPGGLEAC
jgi:hypothetical protein